MRRAKMGQAAALVAALALVGCYQPDVGNGTLQCSTAGQCPGGYHCASDDHCWQDGTDPSGAGGDLAGGDDLAGGGGSGGDLAGTVAAPTGLTTTPASPGNSTTATVSGSAPTGTHVRIYTDSTCSGAVANEGSSDAFAAGLAVSVPPNSTTTFRATASDGVHTSACSDPVTYVEDSTAPAPPTLTGTTPPSPSQSNTTPYVVGTAEAGSTVHLYTSASCTGTVAAAGTAAQLATPGLQVTVPSGSTTTFYANATDAAGNVSPCSAGISYIEDPTLPPAPGNLHTNPMSPSRTATTLLLLGTAASNSTVGVFTTADCSGAPIATGSAATFAATGLSVTVAANSSTTLYANATSQAGKVGPCSTGVVYVEDELAPSTSAAVVRDGANGVDLTWQSTGATYDLTWAGFTDNLSGIGSYEVNLSTSTACSGDVAATMAAGSGSSAHLTGLALGDGTRYYGCVRAIDDAGNVSGWVASNGVTVDLTAPSGGAVSDGTGADIQWQSSTSVADASWTGFSDATSGVASYDFNLSTSSACSGDVLATASTGTATTHHASGLMLMDAVTYYSCARAVDGAGNVGPWVASNGFTIDTDAPSAASATVRDGLGADVQWQQSGASASANWSGFSDIGSGIGAYEVDLSSTTSCAGDLVGARSVGLVTATTLSGLALGDGTTFYFCVRARDLAGNVSAWKASNGVTVDGSAPTAGVVRDSATAGFDQTWTNFNTVMGANWSGFSDGGSGIASYDWNISTTTACAGDAMTTQNVGNVGTINSASVTLSDGVKYYNCIRAYDVAGNVGAWVASNGVTIDIDPPVTGSVNDGTGSDITWQRSTAGMDLNWPGWSDAISGIASYEVRISLSTACNGEVADVSVGNVTSYHASVTLTNGTTYYNCVKAFDAASNNTAFVASNGVTIDATAPTGGTVFDGPSSGSDATWTTSTTTMDASWSGFTDAASGIASYDYNLSTTSACAGDVVANTPVNLSTSRHTTGLTLTDGATYYNCARAHDVAGNFGPWVASNGITVDATPPAGGTVNDGAGPGDAAWSSSAGSMSANWSGFTDAGGVAAYDWCLSSAASCGCDVAAARPVGNVSSYTASGLSLAAGSYYNCVRAHDSAGNIGAFVASNGVGVDSTPPSAPASVNDGAVVGSDLQYQQATASAAANWSAGSDSGSGVAGYDWALASDALCTTFKQAAVDVGNVTVTTQTVPALADATTYTSCVRTRDLAGNVSGWARSNGFTVDTSPPSGAVNDGGGPGDIQWQSSTTSLTGNWVITDATSGVKSFDHMAASDSGCTTALATATGLSASTTLHTLAATLTNGSTYYNCVRATDNVGNVSSWIASNGVTVDTTPPAVSPPSTTMADATHVTLSWSGSDGQSGIASYTVNVCQGASCTPSGVASGLTTTSYTYGVTNCFTYGFSVTAYDVAGNATTSSIVYYTPTPQSVGTLTVVAGAGGVEWSVSNPGTGGSYQFCYSSSANACISGTQLGAVSRSADFVRLPDSAVGVANNFAVHMQVQGCNGPDSTATATQNKLSALYAPAGTASSEDFGAASAIIGDLDGDGAAEWAVGIIPQTSGSHGSFAVYSGATGSSLWTVGYPATTFNPEYFGNTIGTGGDVDGDGTPDLIVTAPLADADSTNIYRGRFFLYKGASSAPSSYLCDSGLAATAQQRYGVGAAIIGDVNGDGHADMLVSGPGNTAFTVGLADVWTYNGTSCSKLSGRSYNGNNTKAEQFGQSVAALGDLDGDGVSEYAVGAPGGGASGSGAIYIYKGSDGTQLTKLDNTNVVTAGYGLGVSLANAGDVDGDGIADLIAGGASTTSAPGHAVVFSGAGTHAVLFDIKGYQTAGTSSSDGFGNVVGSAGDIDGDGHADFFVGAYNTTVGGTAGLGSVYVFSGADGGRLYEYDATSSGGQLAIDAAGGGDVNGDGRPDLVVGANRASSGGFTNNGAAYVLSPSDTLRFSAKPSSSLSNAESWWALGQQGYGPLQAPHVAASGTLDFAATGGAGGSYSYSIISDNSGAGAISVGGVYTAGGIADVFDTIRITDASHRTFDTRIWVKSGALPATPLRPTSLTVQTVSQGNVTLGFGDPATAALQLEARTPTQAWSAVATLPAGGGSYTFAGARSTAYKFRLKARTSTADSAWSGEAAADTN